MTTTPLTPEQATALTALTHRFAITPTGSPAADASAAVTALMNTLDTTPDLTVTDIHHGLALVKLHTDHLNAALSRPTRHHLDANSWDEFALTHIHLALCTNHHPQPAPTPDTDRALAHVRTHVIDTHPEPAPLAYDALCATAAALPTPGAHPHFGPDATTLTHVLALTGHALHHAHRRRHRNHRAAYGTATDTPTLRARFKRRAILPMPTPEPDTIHRHSRRIEQHLHTLQKRM